MFNKYFYISALIILAGCSSIPEEPDASSGVGVPDIPFIDIPFIESSEPEKPKLEIATEVDPVTEINSRGDGYLSFAYNSGHLDNIMVNLKGEQIFLAKGKTVVKKLPVGKYSFEVSGNQIDTERYTAELTYNGHTHKSIFDIPSRYSKIGFRSISGHDVDHKIALLVVGSTLIDPLIELIKLDRPPYVLEIACIIDSELKEGDKFTKGRARGEIAKVTYETVIIGFDPVAKEALYGTRTCGYSDKVTYTSPLRMTLPEGLYRMNASGESKNIYVRGGNVNTIEITSNGFVGNTDDWK